MSLTGKQIGELKSLYESVYDDPEELKYVTEEQYIECVQDVLATALVESGLLDVEFEGNEGDIYEKFGLKTMYNIAKTAYQKNPQTFKNIGKGLLGAGAVDTLNQDAVSGKRNMFLRVGLSKLKNLPSDLRNTYTTVQSGAKDSGNKVVDISGTGLSDQVPNKDGKTTTQYLQKRNQKIMGDIRNQRNKDK